MRGGAAVSRPIRRPFCWSVFDIVDQEIGHRPAGSCGSARQTAGNRPLRLAWGRSPGIDGSRRPSGGAGRLGSSTAPGHRWAWGPSAKSRVGAVEAKPGHPPRRSDDHEDGRGGSPAGHGVHRSFSRPGRRRYPAHDAQGFSSIRAVDQPVRRGGSGNASRMLILRWAWGSSARIGAGRAGYLPEELGRRLTSSGHLRWAWGPSPILETGEWPRGLRG